MEPTARTAKFRLILFIALAFVGGIALTLGAVWAFGGDRETPQRESQSVTETTQDDETSESESSDPDSEDSDVSTEEKVSAGHFTLETAQEACDAELRAQFSGLDPHWDDRRSVQKQEGDAWFFKAPASGGPYPGENWAKCKVGGTPETPEWYVVRVD